MTTEGQQDMQAVRVTTYLNGRYLHTDRKAKKGSAKRDIKESIENKREIKKLIER